MWQMRFHYTDVAGPGWRIAMNLRTHQLLVGSLLGIFTGLAFAQGVVTAPFAPDSGNLTIRCGVLIDGVTDEPRQQQTVVIVDGRFGAVRSDSARVDLGAYVGWSGRDLRDRINRGEIAVVVKGGLVFKMTSGKTE